MTYQEECEAKGRALLKKPRERGPRKTASHFRTASGTVTIDQHGTFSYRPLRRRKVYSTSLEKLCCLVLQKQAMAEAAAKRAARNKRAR